MTDPDTRIQEQALHIVRHIADGVDEVDLVFSEMGGSEAMLGSLAVAMESEDEDVVLQVRSLSLVRNRDLNGHSLPGGIRLGKYRKQSCTSAKYLVESANTASLARMSGGCEGRDTTSGSLLCPGAGSS